MTFDSQMTPRATGKSISLAGGKGGIAQFGGIEFARGLFKI